MHEIRLRIGVLSGVVPDALRFAFETLAPGTAAAGAVLEIEEVPARFWCAACRREFVSANFFADCPDCGSPSAELRAGRELELTKALTTLGRPGVQVAAITRRAEGYFIVHVDSGKENDFPHVNGVPIGPQARRLNDNDVVQLAGVKMGFFES